MAKLKFTPWSTLNNMMGKPPHWWPAEEQERMASYDKYDQLYWNDPTQYAIRVLEGETPLYIPNARTIVDTTANFLLKGLKVGGLTGDDGKFLTDFLKRERFYSRFHMNKKAGIARGDYAFHLTADPLKPEGKRISLEPIHPGTIMQVPHPDDPDDIIRIHIVTIWIDPQDAEQKERIRKLTYEKVPVGAETKIQRSEAIYEVNPTWYGPEPQLYKVILKPELLPDPIDEFPIYWFPNIEWPEQDYGSSELRGLEFLSWAVSQGATDTEMALALEGLGVFATDGGRPVNAAGEEVDWEVSPGKVMELPAGSYFRRVDGVGSITPMMDQIKYLEQKMYQATSTTDVALGQVDVQTANSGIALAIKFMPTLAKISDRDQLGVETLEQMWFNWKKWVEAYENRTITEDITVTIDANKLPKNPTEGINELNNLYDRKIISGKFYAEKMREYGYDIDFEKEQKQVLEEAQAAAEVSALAAPPGLQQNAEDAAAGKKVITNANGGNNDQVDAKENQSNNRSRPNESSGTESGQSLARQTKS